MVVIRGVPLQGNMSTTYEMSAYSEVLGGLAMHDNGVYRRPKSVMLI